MAPTGGPLPLNEPLLAGASEADADLDDDINEESCIPVRQQTMGTQVRHASKMCAEGGLMTPVVTSPWTTSKGEAGLGAKNSAAARAAKRRLRKQVMISCFIMFAEGYYATQVFPYIASMAEDLRHSKESVGFYSGLLYTCQSIGNLATAVFWAKMSNKYGRRVCLLTGLAFNLCATVGIAVLQDYWLIFGLRLLSGLMNSNLSIMRTSLRESFSYEEEDDTSAFSMLSVAFGASSVCGPSIGGILYGSQLPFGLGDGWANPWTSPLLTCTALYTLCLVTTFSVMPETAFLTDQLVPIAPGKQSNGRSGAVKSGSQPSDSKNLLKDSRFLLLLIVGGGHSFTFTGWELAYPLVARVPADDDGEGWSTAEIGITFLVGSVGLMTYSLLLYPRIVRKVTVIRVWVYSWIIPLLIYPSFPRILTAVVSAGHETHGGMVNLLNYVAQLFISVLLGSGFISIQLMLNSYVASRPGARTALAVANSWMVSTQALVRAVSPMSTGALFTLGIQAENDGSAFLSRSLPFDFLAVIGLVSCVLCALEFERRMLQELGQPFIQS